MNTDKLYAEQLANEYAPKNTSRVVALRKLDAKAKLPATAFTYAFGITSALIFGTGLCLAMGQIGSGTTGSFVLGILMGVVGMAVNFLYVAFRIVAGIRYASVWFLTMAVYYPDYWGTMPMAVYTFLEHYDLTGKTIHPFCTHKGSGLSRTEQDIRKAAPGAVVTRGLAIRGSSVDEAADEIAQWVKDKKNA